MIDPDPSDPGCLGIDGSLPAEQRRNADPERSGDIRRCEVPSLLQLENSPVTAAVLVPVDMAGHPTPIVAELEPDHLSAPALAAVLPLVLPDPPEGDGGQRIQGDAGSQGESSAYVTGLAPAWRHARSLPAL